MIATLLSSSPHLLPQNFRKLKSLLGSYKKPLVLNTLPPHPLWLPVHYRFKHKVSSLSCFSHWFQPKVSVWPHPCIHSSMTSVLFFLFFFFRYLYPQYSHQCSVLLEFCYLDCHITTFFYKALKTCLLTSPSVFIFMIFSTFHILS